MQASKMTMDGSRTVALLEILGVVGQRLHRSALGVDLVLENEHVFEPGAAMLADIAEWKLADLHAMHHERPRDAEDAGHVVRTELLVFGEDSDPVAFEQVTEKGLDQRRGVRRQGQGLIGPGPPLDAHFDAVALANLAETACFLAVL